MADAARLLLVDDNRVNRLLLARQLGQLGHRVDVAENGHEALAMLRENAYDLLVLDIEMPGMDGFEVLVAMKFDLVLRDLPVIVTSALEGLDNVVRCIELGAEDYLHKPVNPVLLKARIGAGLEKKRLRDAQREAVARFATQEVAHDLAISGFALGGRAVDASVMFCDIRGFTGIVESSTPDAVIELLNAWYTLMFDAIAAHGGVVNQMIGDGLMAVFGAPQRLEDPPRAAVSAALEMIEMVAQFSDEQRAAGKAPIRIGIGIASGNVVAGYTGTEARATYTCVGDTVNLAARLEAHTKEAGVPLLVDERTRSRLPPNLQLKSLGDVQFKGKSAAVPVFGLASGN
jgi:class 3 adenylate cyclase